jgi:hypothetical protein
MLNDPNFNADYAYTGLISQTKQVNDAYWVPMNISVCFHIQQVEIKIIFSFFSIIVH